MPRAQPVLFYAALCLASTACRPQADSDPSGGLDTGLDPTADADGDGVSNGQELEEGTDPLDPSSASGWHPEWTERPRMLADPGGLDTLADAFERGGDPWETLAASNASRCAAEPVEDDETLVSSTTNGNIALACAVEYLRGDSEAGAKAAEVLETLPIEADITGETVYYTDLRAGQGLLQGARAYDLLLALGYPAGHDPQDAHERLHALGSWLWDYYVETYPQWMEYAQNNHATKLAATFGTLGMAAWDDERSARYVNYAVAELTRLRGVLHTDDGGYAEGPSYLVYGMESELPFMAAFDRWAGDAAVVVKPICAHRSSEDCSETLEEQASPLRDARVCDAFERFVEQLMPAGYGPNTDDSNLASAQLGVVAGLCDAPAAAWGWEFQGTSWFTGGSVMLHADSLLGWDAAPEGVAPEAGPMLREDAGWAVLRTGWERDSAYALLLGEHGLARESGSGHEHPDALSYLWAAGGHYLLIDSGYGNWAEHDEVNDAEAHNLFLVDGEGPGAADAWVDEVRAEGEVQLARGHVSYGGVEWSRTLALVGEDVLVVLDSVEPDDGASHELALQSQGPNDSMSLADGLARWTVEEHELQLMVISDQDLSLTQRSEQHAFSYSDYQQHGVLEASTTVNGSSRWLTVARVAMPGEDAGLEAMDGGVSWPGGSASLDGVIELSGDALEL